MYQWPQQVKLYYSNIWTEKFSYWICEWKHTAAISDSHWHYIQD